MGSFVAIIKISISAKGLYIKVYASIYLWKRFWPMDYHLLLEADFFSGRNVFRIYRFK